MNAGLFGIPTGQRLVGAIADVPDRAALKALNTNAIKTAILREGSRAGIFVWRAGNYSSFVSADTREGIFIPSKGAPSSSGAWVRVHNEGVYDVKWFGALGDNATNDYAAIQGTINFAQALAGGTVLLSMGGYLIGTGLAINTPLVRLAGVGCRYSSLRSIVANLTLVSITAARCAVENLSIFHHQVIATSQSALIFMGPGSVQCVLSDLDLVGGWNALLFGSGSVNNTVRDIVARATYGGQIVDIQGGQFISFHDCVLDHDWAVQVPAPANFKGARANSTAYNAGDVVTLSGFYIQCRVAGTTAGSPPSLQPYETDITDGTVQWRLANRQGAVALRIDTGAKRIRVVDTDHTGAYENGITISNSLAGAAPDEIMISRCESSGIMFNGVALTDGNRVTIDDSEFNSPVGDSTITAGILTTSSFAGDLVVSKCRVASGFDNGVYLNAGTNSHVHGCRLYATAGVRIGADVSKFSVQDNDFSSTTWGSATTGVLVEAGASDNYIITGNILAGASTGISDGGTGVNKTVQDNHDSYGRVRFPATQNASSDANTLDDYEEGTWTPTIAGVTTAGSHTYSVQAAKYTKVGNVVTLKCHVTLTAKDGAMAGAVEIRGLPFAASNSPTGMVYAGDVGFFQNVDLAAGNVQLTAVMFGGASAIQLWETVDNGAASNLLAAGITATTDVVVGLTYQV